MPLYEYTCEACGKDTEAMQKFSDKPLKKCPNCGENKLKKKISLAGFQLKGSGWYKDGYVGGSNPAGDKPEKPDSSGKSEKKPEKSEKSDKKDSESKTSSEKKSSSNTKNQAA